MSLQAEQVMMNNQPIQSHAGPYVSQQYRQAPYNQGQQVIHEQPIYQSGYQQPYQQQVIIVQQQPSNQQLSNDHQIQRILKCFYWMNGILFVLVLINIIVSFVASDVDTATAIMIVGDFFMLFAICFGISAVYRRQPQQILLYMILSAIATIILIISVIVGISSDDKERSIIGGSILGIMIIIGQFSLVRSATRIRQVLIAQKLQQTPPTQ